MFCLNGYTRSLQYWHYKPTPSVEFIAKSWLTWLLSYDALLQPCGRLGKCISGEERRQQWWCELGRVAVYSGAPTHLSPPVAHIGALLTKASARSLSPIAIDKAITHSSPLRTPVFIGTKTNEVSRCSSSSNTELRCEHAALKPRRARAKSFNQILESIKNGNGKMGHIHINWQHIMWIRRWLK